VSVHRAIARLIENRGQCISASGSLVLQHGHATKPCFFAPRTRIGFGFPASAALTTNRNVCLVTASQMASAETCHRLHL
jgi:hypothetical protein